jgi:flagellin
VVAGLSFVTNQSAMIALQELTFQTQRLRETQLSITTGLKVSGPKQDGAAFAIATRLRGDVAGLNSVKTALATGEAQVNVAVSAAKSIADLLTEIKAKVVAANQSGLDSSSRSALESDFTALRSQLQTIVDTADLDTVNLIKRSASTLNVLSSVEGSVIAVSAQPLDVTTLGIGTLTLLSSAAASTALTAVNSAIELAADKLSALGTSAKRLEIQSDFTTNLLTSFAEGIGAQVDTDLAEASALLQAQQIQQQLSVQALAIANAAPTLVLGLFPIPGGRRLS